MQRAPQGGKKEREVGELDRADEALEGPGQWRATGWRQPSRLRFLSAAAEAVLFARACRSRDSPSQGHPRHHVESKMQQADVKEGEREEAPHCAAREQIEGPIVAFLRARNESHDDEHIAGLNKQLQEGRHTKTSQHGKNASLTLPLVYDIKWRHADAQEVVEPKEHPEQPYCATSGKDASCGERNCPEPNRELRG